MAKKTAAEKKAEEENAAIAGEAYDGQSSHDFVKFNYDSKDAETCWLPGYYKAQLIDTDVGVSKSSGENMLTVRFKIWTGEDTQVLSDHIVPKTLNKLKRLASALSESEAFVKNTFQPFDFIGEGLIVELNERDDETHGKQNTIAGYRHQAWEPTEKDLQTKVAPDLVAPAF